MTVALTIVSGLALLVLGQIIIRSFIDPVYELRRLRGEIANGLTFYANIYMNPGSTERAPEKIDAAVNELRSFGSRLQATRHSIPFYEFFSLLRAVPSSESMERARSNLIGLSNSVYNGKYDDNERRRGETIDALKLKSS